MISISSRHFAVAGLAAALLGLATTATLADDVRQAGPMVSVTGTGGKLEAAGASVTVGGTVSELSAAGALVTVDATTTGKANIAGAQVAVSGTYGGELSAVGAVVDVTGTASGSANVGGAVAKVNLTTAGNLRVAGASVVIAPTNDVKGDLNAYGAIITIGGHIGGKVDSAGAVVTFNAQSDGPVVIAGSKVVIGPEARVTGDLTIRSLNDPEISATAVITGATNREQPQTWWAIAPWKVALYFAAAVAAGTILTGIVLMLFGGQVFTAATEHVRHRPLSSFLFGILAFILIPFIAIVLMATVIGLSAGFALLFVMPLLIVFGHAVAAAGIAGGLLVRGRGALGLATNLLMLVIGAIVVVAIGFIPYIGPALVFVALILGVGAFTRTIGSRIRRSEPQPMV